MESEKCLTELDEVLNYLKAEELSKIPENIRNSIKERKDKNYIWKYDESKKLNEQNLNRKTIAMLSYLNMEYLCNDEQRKLLKKMHEYNEREAEMMKERKYDSDVFKNRNIKKVENVSERALVEVKKEKWYEKILNFFRRKK